jgi:hypothetical protein
MSSAALAKLNKAKQTKFFRRNIGAVKQYLEDPNSSALYTSMAEVLTQISLRSEVRVLLAFADGHVIFDSAKNNNTLANFQAQLIDENHNTRPEVMRAITAGEASAERVSSTVSVKSMYHAMRVGPTAENNMATLRLSVVI